jgi:hypothetical protein
MTPLKRIKAEVPAAVNILLVLWQAATLRKAKQHTRGETTINNSII